MALTRKGTVFAWTMERQAAFDALKSCLLRAPILGFPTESDQFVLDTDASLFAVGGVLNQIQEVVIAYANRSLRLSQRWYCATRREMFAAVTMCTHFRSYLHGAQCTLRTDHRSLRWLQKFSDGMLARWYMLLGQFSVTFEYRPMTDQPFAESVMGDSMDTDLLPEMSGETWVATVHLDEATGDLTPPDSDPAELVHMAGCSMSEC